MTGTDVNNIIVDKFANLTMHGFPNAYSTTSTQRRFAWLIITFVAIGFCLYGIMSTVLRYYTYPVAVDVTYGDESALAFPAVTVCNVNTQRKSQVALLSARYQNDSEYTDESGALRLGALSDDEHIDLGHQLSDMLLSCTYKNTSCNATHFIWINGSFESLGNCYTFNSGLDHAVDVEGERAMGREGALKLILDTEQDEYMDSDEGSGFQIMIHESGHVPTPDTKTISVSPGQSTFIELSQVRLMRALKPHGICEPVSEEENEQFNMWSHYGYNYSTSACKHTYKQRLVIERCGCYDAEMPSPDFIRHGAVSCTEAQKRCVVNTFIEFDKTPSLRDACPYLCHELIFLAVVSNNEWPAATNAELVAERYFPGKNVTLDAIREGMLEVSVYYEGSKVKTIEETPIYSVLNLLGEIGGHLGLWVGGSLIALIEFLEIGFDLAYAAMCTM